jgi:hypothetical protein
MFDFFWDLYQQRQISELRSDLSRAQSGKSAGNRQLADLERRVDLLALTTMATWSLIAGRLGLSDADLQAEMKRLDMADGVEDGRVNQPRHCPDCSRPVARRINRCIYCGTHVGSQL